MEPAQGEIAIAYCLLRGGANASQVDLVPVPNVPHLLSINECCMSISAAKQQDQVV